jgi:hypothetical protein
VEAEAIAAIFFFFPVQRPQPLFFLLVVLPFFVFFANSVFSVVVLSGSVMATMLVVE